MTADYRALVAEPRARYLIATSLFARAPLGMAALATLLLVQSHDRGYGVAGLAVGATAVCGALVAPLVGALVDRLGQTRVLLPLGIANAAAWVGLLLSVRWEMPDAAIVAVAGVVGALRPPVAACVRVLWPEVTPAGVSTETAYAVDATLEEVNWVAGPLAVGLVGALAPDAPVLLCAAFSLAGTGALAASPASRRWRNPPGRRRARAGALESPGLRVVLFSAVLFGFSFGAGEIALPALASDLDAPNAGGPLIALWCLGSLVAGLAYGARRWRAPLARRYAACLLLSAVTMAPLMAADSLATAIPFAVLAGIGLAPTLTCQYALVSRLAPAGTVTEAFTWVNAALIAGVAGGAASAGIVVEKWSPTPVFGLGIVAALMAAVLVAWRYCRLERGPAPAPAALAP